MYVYLERVTCWAERSDAHCGRPSDGMPQQMYAYLSRCTYIYIDVRISQQMNVYDLLGREERRALREAH